MARKFMFDTAITKNLKAAASDSFVDNIKMIDVAKLVPSKDNFYDIQEIEILAEDIERQGLKHNLVVTDNGDDTYTIVSGHRRCLAKLLLIEQNRSNSSSLPCYIEGADGTEAKLDLIMLNATQRKYSDTDLMNEYESLVEICRELEDSGKKIGGRLREYIAQVLKVSPAQIGKIENIKNNAIPEVIESVKNGDVSISTANEIAKLDKSEQQQLTEKKDLTYTAAKEIKETKAKASNKLNDAQKNCTPITEEITAPIMPEQPADMETEKENKDLLVKSLTLVPDEILILSQYISGLMEQCKPTEPFAYSVLRSLSKKLWTNENERNK